MYTTTNTSYSLKIDQDQALDHLKALGYEQGDKVYVRYIHPISKKSTKAAKLDFKSANHYQAQGYDVYFVVNGGGDTDSAVTQGCSIFYEHDNLDKSIQLKLWQTLGLPVPTIQVDTGGKSIHSYWVFDTPIAPKQWRELQTDLLEFSDGDRALKNPSRILRLAGSWYMKGDKPGTLQAALVSNSDKRYSYGQLRGAIPIKQTPALEQLPTQQITPKTGSSFYTSKYLHFEDIQVPVPESVPIYNCLSKESRTLIEFGVSADRNVNGAKLARDLIGTANYLQSINQPFLGDSWQLFLDYCHRCLPGNNWNEREWQCIWKSALGDNPSPSCKPEGVETCVKAWYWNNEVKPNGTGRTSDVSIINAVRGGVNGGGKPPINAISLRDRIIEILNRNHLTSERKAAFIELAGSCGRSLREIEQLAEVVETEVEVIESRTDNRQELDDLLLKRDRRLTLSKYLHKFLANPLEQLGTRMGVDTEALLTVLLPTAASLLHPETRVIVKECIDFVEPMIFYSGVVSESGSRKSPIFKSITKVLKKLQEEENKRYEKEWKVYEEQQKKKKPDDEDPIEPAPLREYYVDNITSEAINRVKSRQPDHGFLIRKDELSGLFSSYNAYKGGRGSDKEGVLSGWNGDGIKVNRADGSRLALSHDATSIAGAIQPGKLKKIMGDLEDEQGEWARFLWYLAPLRSFRLPDDDCRFSLEEMLEGIYRKLDKLAPVKYRFSPDAQRVYQDWHWKLEQQKLSEPKQGMRSAIAKMQGYTARIAGILHILWAVAAGEEPSLNIPLERVKAARQLAEFYLGQVQLIHSDGEVQTGELTPIFAKIFYKAQNLGSITTRIAKASIFALRKAPASKIQDYLNELVAMGYFRTEGGGARTKFIPKSVDGLKKPEIIDNNRLEITNSTSVDVYLPSVDVSVDGLKKPEIIDNDRLEITNSASVDGVDLFCDFTTAKKPQVEIEQKQIGTDKTIPTSSINTINTINTSTESIAKKEKSPSTLTSTVHQQPSTLRNKNKKVRDLKVGDRVLWDSCPPHCQNESPFIIRAIAENRAWFNWVNDSVSAPMRELRLEV